MSQNILDWLHTKPSMSTFNSQSSEDIEEAMAGGLNKVRTYKEKLFFSSNILGKYLYATNLNQV